MDTVLRARSVLILTVEIHLLWLVTYVCVPLLDNAFLTRMVVAFSFLLTDNVWLFTHFLLNIYTPPNGFCFDIFCDDTPIMV